MKIQTHSTWSLQVQVNRYNSERYRLINTLDMGTPWCPTPAEAAEWLTRALRSEANLIDWKSPTKIY